MQRNVEYYAGSAERGAVDSITTHTTLKLTTYYVPQKGNMAILGNLASIGLAAGRIYRLFWSLLPVPA